MEFVVAFAVMLVLLLIAVFVVSRVQAPSLVKKTVVVQMKDGTTIRGVLHGKYADLWTLREAQVVGAGAQDQPLGGLQHVPVTNISFVQEVEPPEAEKKAA